MATTWTDYPSKYRQRATKDLLRRTLRLRKTQIANNIQFDPDLVDFETAQLQSVFAPPIILHAHVKANLEVGDRVYPGLGKIQLPSEADKFNQGGNFVISTWCKASP